MNPKILIVDDDEDVLDVVQIFLEQQGIKQIVSFHSGRGVEKAVADIKPDIVFLDIMLPDTDGVTLLKKLIPIHPAQYYMLTAYKDADKVLEAIKIGAKDVLLKPINWDYLKKLLYKQ